MTTCRRGRLPGPDGRRLAGGARTDDGVATVLACVCAMALIALTGLAAQFGAALLARHRAEIAADLGALAGAATVVDEQPSACRRAAEVVAANGGAVAACSVEGADVLVTVTVVVHLGPMAGTATGRARAGPVDASVS